MLRGLQQPDCRSSPGPADRTRSGFRKVDRGSTALHPHWHSFRHRWSDPAIDRGLQRIGLRQQLNLFIPRFVYFLILLCLQKQPPTRWAQSRFQTQSHVLLLCAEHRRRASACDSRRIVGTIFGRPGCRIGAEFQDRFRRGARNASESALNPYFPIGDKSLCYNCEYDAPVEPPPIA